MKMCFHWHKFSLSDIHPCFAGSASGNVSASHLLSYRLLAWNDIAVFYSYCPEPFGTSPGPCAPQTLMCASQGLGARPFQGGKRIPGAFKSVIWNQIVEWQLNSKTFPLCNSLSTQSLWVTTAVCPLALPRVHPSLIIRDEWVRQQLVCRWP